jgi:hypothetical protein
MEEDFSYLLALMLVVPWVYSRVYWSESKMKLFQFCTSRNVI